MALLPFQNCSSGFSVDEALIVGTDESANSDGSEEPSPAPTIKPSAANTGWQPTGVTLAASAGMTITTDGTTIDSRDFTGAIIIQASNVTIRRSRVRTTNAYFPIKIVSGTNILLEDIEVDGGGFSSKGILIEDGSVTIRRLNLHDSEDGIHISGSGPVVLENSYVHSPRHAASGHSDGLEIEAASNVTIRNNNLDYAGANTSATMIDNYYGSVSDLIYEGNWLAGGAYNMYIDGNFNSSQIKNVKVRNNRWIRGSSAYGELVARGALSAICWEGNVYDDNGQSLGYDGPAQVACGSSGSSGSPTPTPPSNKTLLGWELTEASTGLAGVGVDRNSLPAYTGSDTPAAGTVIRLVKITKPLFLHKGNITLDRVWFQPTYTSGQGSLIFTYDPSFSTPGAGPVTIMDSDLDGSKVSDSRVYTDAMVRGTAHLYRNNIFGSGSGIAIFGASAMPNVIVENNYVHDLRSGMFGTPPQQSHNESATIRAFNGTSLTFRSNRLVSKSGSDSGALFIQAWAGVINNVLVEGNLFETYGWCLPLEANQSGYGNNMRARNNRFVKGGYGPAYVTGGPGWAEWTENYIDDPTKADRKGASVGKP